MKSLFKLFGRSKNPEGESPDNHNNKSSNPDDILQAALEKKENGNKALAEGDLITAERCYREALGLNPDYALGYINLGFVLLQLENISEAEKVLKKGLTLDDQMEDAYYLLGKVELARGQPADAVEYFESAISIKPYFAEPLEYLGKAYLEQGRKEEAAECYVSLAELHPELTEFGLQAGLLLTALKQPARAVEILQKAVALEPENPNVLFALARAKMEDWKLDEATALLEKSLEIQPDFNVALEWSGRLYRDQGFPKLALECYRKQLEFNPDYHGAFSNLLTNLEYDPDLSPEEIFAQHRLYAERYEEPLKRLWKNHPNSRDPDRRIRLGYLSPDFRDHPVTLFLLPILRTHNHDEFEIFCYHDQEAWDDYTHQVEELSDHFVRCKDLTDSELFARIQDDRIDILVDLTGHFGATRIRMLGAKPAPVQVTWIGHPATTGLSAMDYRLTDGHMDPPGMTERYHSEKLVRLTYISSFEPWADAPPVNPLPALTNGYLTFGSLNNLVKINDRVIALWARVISEIPNSRLIIGSVNSERASRRFLDTFASHGIDSKRLDLRKSLPPQAPFLKLHHEIDIALDPFPFGGLTTSFHHVWMGVPVLNIAGNNTPSRLAVTVMRSAGWPEFISESEDDYVRRAVEWAGNLPGLNQVRQSLRGRLLERLIDNPELNLAREAEAAFRKMWVDYCRTHQD